MPKVITGELVSKGWRRAEVVAGAGGAEHGGVRDLLAKGKPVGEMVSRGWRGAEAVARVGNAEQGVEERLLPEGQPALQVVAGGAIMRFRSILKTGHGLKGC